MRRNGRWHQKGAGNKKLLRLSPGTIQVPV
jgi:hypothetical protein